MRCARKEKKNAQIVWTTDGAALLPIRISRPHIEASSVFREFRLSTYTVAVSQGDANKGLFKEADLYVRFV